MMTFEEFVFQRATAAIGMTMTAGQETAFCPGSGFLTAVDEIATKLKSFYKFYNILTLREYNHWQKHIRATPSGAAVPTHLELPLLLFMYRQTRKYVAFRPVPYSNARIKNWVKFWQAEAAIQLNELRRPYRCRIDDLRRFYPTPKQVPRREAEPNVQFVLGSPTRRLQPPGANRYADGDQ